MSLRAPLFSLSCAASLAVAACGGSVKSEASPAPARAPSAASPPAGIGGDASVPSVIAPTTLGALSCAENENALIVGSDDVRSFGAFMRRNAFRPSFALPRAAQLATFADPQGGLGVVFVERDGTYSQAQTSNGEAVEVTAPMDCRDKPRCFAPTVNGDLVALGSAGVVGTVLVQGEVPRWTPAYFDSDAKIWVSTDAGVYADRMSDFAAGVLGAESVLVYTSVDRHLVDSIGTADTWAPPHVHAAITVARDSEIQVTTLAVGVNQNALTVFYRTVSNGALAIGAITRRGGAFGAPVVTAVDPADPIVRFAVSGTPSGGFVLAGTRTSGKLELRSFDQGVFSPPMLTGESDVDPEGAIAMAPGLCGDDAWLTYGASGGDVRLMRIRSGSISSSSSIATSTPSFVAHLGSAPRAGRLSIVTRAR